MRRSPIFTLYRRELRDVLRDRRTLFTMLVLPVILYPAMMLGFTKLTVSRTEELFRQEFDVDLRLAGRPLVRGGAETDDLAAAVLGVERFRLLSATNPADAVRSGELDLAVDLPEGARGALADGRDVVILPVHRSADEDSSAALRLFTQAVEGWRDRTWPLRIESRSGDQSSGSERGGRLFGGMLAMMVVMMAMTGAFYPALDVAAGEKERGTLETLLLSPATRRQLVLGKYLTVLTVAVVAALMNLASLSFTIGGFSSVIGAARGQQMPFTIGPEAFAVILVGLLITAALFAAVCLALSTFARSYKEGQTYLTPALLLVMPLSMTALLPNMKLDPGLAAVPIANLALLMKEVLSGRFPGVETGITLGTLLLLALAALQWTVALFEREDVLFREGRQVFGLRPPKGLPRPARPPFGVALLGIVAALGWMYQAGTRLAAAAPWVQIAVTMSGLAVIAVGLPALAMVRLPSGLGLTRPRTDGYLTGAVVGVGALLVSTAVFRAQSSVLGEPDPGLGEMLGGILADSAPLALVLLALLPAVAEELLFRGLLLQGLRGVAKDAIAILVSAIAFGLFHLSAHRTLPQAMAGVAFGVLALRARSILPAMAAHATHNALAVLTAAGILTPLGELLDGAPPLALFLGGAAIIVAAARLTRPRDDAPADS